MIEGLRETEYVKVEADDMTSAAILFWWMVGLASLLGITTVVFGLMGV